MDNQSYIKQEEGMVWHETKRGDSYIMDDLAFDNFIKTKSIYAKFDILVKRENGFWIVDILKKIKKV